MERTLLTARLVSKLLLSERTQCFHFDFAVETAAGSPHAFDFIPGQFVSLVAPDHRGKQQTRAYSIASAPQGNHFHLCVNRVEDGFFSNLLADLEPGGTVQFHGPHGLFTLRQPLQDVIMIATGTGIAPMRGFIEHLFPADGNRLLEKARVWLVYGTRHQSEIYYQHFFEMTAAEHSNFRYLPTLSRPHDGWEGLRGYVQQQIPAVLEDRARTHHSHFVPPAPPVPEEPVIIHPEKDLADNPRHSEPDSFDVHAYICGLNEMVSANRDQLKEFGWHRKQIVYERYD